MSLNLIDNPNISQIQTYTGESAIRFCFSTLLFYRNLPIFLPKMVK